MDAGSGWSGTEDPRALSRKISAAHDAFLDTGRPGSDVRPLVARSWQRCLQDGIDPETLMAPVELSGDALERYRTHHPLHSVMPVIRSLLVPDALDAGLLVAVADAAGRLLWVEGQPRVLDHAEAMNFVPGASWDEGSAGTNAPGTALAEGQPVRIFAAEHLSRTVTPWSCSAAPIHDPDTGAIIGALDLTGGAEVATPHTLALVRATVAAAESELRLQRLLSPARLPATEPPATGLRAQSLGRESTLLTRPDGETRLSLRHSELLTLVAAHPDGISGEQLAVALRERDVAPVTLRAEISRLRPLLGDVTLSARPYRLSARLAHDVDQVASLVAQRRVGTAVALYRGPLLPQSQAPGVVRLRERLHEDLRAALLDSGDADALLRFADTEHGQLDWYVWHAVDQALPRTSPRRSQVDAHLAYLARELEPRTVHLRR